MVQVFAGVVLVYGQSDMQNGYTLVGEMLVGSVEDCR